MKLLCLDSNSILNRAFYGIKMLSTPEGVYTNAMVGYMNILGKLLEEVRPDAVVCAFDLPAPTFRHERYVGYKAQRKGMPPELAAQLPLIKELLGSLGYQIVTAQGYEADDILGTFAHLCREAGDTCVIATGDRDSLQLVSQATTVLLASTKNGKPLTTVCTPAYIQETYGLQAHQLIDVKALMGDASDNIPGVAGIGEKGALKLITEYGSLDGVYEALGDIPAAKLREKLESGRESAYMSRMLAEIYCTVPLEVTVADCVPRESDQAAAFALLSRLHMFALIDRLGLSSAETRAACAPAPIKECKVNDEAALEVLLQTTEPLYLLCDFRGDDVATFALDTPAYTLLFAPDMLAFPALLKRVLEAGNPKWVNASKPLYRYAFLHHIKLAQAAFDVELAGYLLNPEADQYGIRRMADSFGVPVPPSEETAGPDGAGCLCVLCECLQEEITKNELDSVLRNIELPLARVLASMELAGVELDASGLERFGEELDGNIRTLEQNIYTYAGESFNINSPKQLGTILFEKLDLPLRRKNKSGYSTDAEVLESLSVYHPIAKEILEYRQLAKLKSTYVDGLLKALGSDGRIHCVFKQTETRTGRISSTEPNMQNIPVRTALGSTMRKFFLAREGCLLVDADYSQIELRVLAHIADDATMREAFCSGADIHTQTAAQVFGLPPDRVSAQMRSRAKAVNFGIVYGIGAFSLSKDIGVSVAEADQYIKSYLETYSGVREYMQRTIENATRDGFVTTLFGRRRYLPELVSTNKNMQAFGRRVAMNTPIQGTAADVIKLAMIRVFERLEREGLRARLILQVHDELIVEAPQDEVQRVGVLLREEMEGAAQLSVTLRADLNTGKSWYDAK